MKRLKGLLHRDRTKLMGPPPAAGAFDSVAAARAVRAATRTPAPRVHYVWNGITIEKRFARRPIIHRLDVSHPRGSGVGENPIEFPGFEG